MHAQDNKEQIMGQVPRRAFLSRLGVVLGTTPWASWAQASRRRRIGFFSNNVPLADLTGKIPANGGARLLVNTLAELGWVVGQNIEIIWRSAEQQYERRPQLIDELVRLPVDVILVSGNHAVEDALRATKTIPIVMVNSHDPVGNKLVASYARPGGNVTGLDMGPQITVEGKRLTLLKEAVPGLKTVAFLRAPQDTFARTTFEAGRQLGLNLVGAAVDGPASFQAALSSAVRQGANGLHVAETPVLVARRNQPALRSIIERHRLPAIHSSPNHTAAGTILNYGPDLTQGERRAAIYVDRILKGAHPQDLPIEQPTSFLLVVNKRAASAIGMTIPPSLIAQADRVID